MQSGQEACEKIVYYTVSYIDKAKVKRLGPQEVAYFQLPCCPDQDPFDAAHTILSRRHDMASVDYWVVPSAVQA